MNAPSDEVLIDLLTREVNRLRAENHALRSEVRCLIFSYEMADQTPRVKHSYSLHVVSPDPECLLCTDPTTKENRLASTVERLLAIPAARDGRDGGQFSYEEAGGYNIALALIRSIITGEPLEDS